LKQRSLLLFENGIKSEATRVEYLKNLDRFKDFFKLKDYDSILGIPEKKLQEMVEDYVMDLKNKVSPNTIPTRIYPLQAFFEINDVDLKWSKIRRLFPAKVKKSGRKAYTTEQIQEMLKFCSDIRNRAIILFMAASGCRVGALPYLKIKDIKNIEDCKHVVIYSGEIEEYSSFLTPEASQAFDCYLEKRKKDGEYMDEESPAFRKTYRLGIEKAKPVTNRTVSEMMQRLLKTSRLRSNKNGSRYETQLDHGLRKRFDTIMKQTDSMKLIHAEKMFGHSIPSIPLDETYADFSVESLFKEYKKAIPELTISDSERLTIRNEKLEMEKKESENQSTKIKDLEHKLEMVIHKMDMMQNTSEIKSDITKN
jgi:integrase/recombinase XerD